MSTVPNILSKIVAGFHFLSSAERNYVLIEGEVLGVAWSLENTRYFTMGCNDLLVVVDHKPLIKLLGDRIFGRDKQSKTLQIEAANLDVEVPDRIST